MKSSRNALLAASLGDIAKTAPSERLGADSRFVIACDLGLGDGGRNDCLTREREAVVDVFGRWYLERGYTLVLNGDVEDVREYWLKDILANWAGLYAVFDAFRDQGRLRKIAGDRDLALLKVRSYPYEILHGLRLDGKERSMLVVHGHQAAPPYVDQEYLKGFIAHWQGSAKQRKVKKEDEDASSRFRVERRMYRAASGIGMLAIIGHTRRPLFASMTNRESIREEIETLLRDRGLDDKAARVIELAAAYGIERSMNDRSRDGERLTKENKPSPCLFCPGRLLGGKFGSSRSLRLLEIEGDRISLVRWTADGREGAQSLGRRNYRRIVTNTASIEELFVRSVVETQSSGSTE